MEGTTLNALDIAIQKAVEQARDTNFFEAGTTGRGEKRGCESQTGE
jgi:hypothetical protein